MSKPKVERLTVFCQGCKKEIKHNPKETNTTHNNRKYCSYKCQNKKILKKCKLCNSEYNIHLYRKHSNNFCSISCRNEYYSLYNVGENAPNWNGGKSYEKYDICFNRKLKQEIRKRDNEKCQICGVFQEKPALDIHHIDYNKKNSKSINLISLCHSCHSKIPNQSVEWRKYFENRIRS